MPIEINGLTHTIIVDCVHWQKLASYRVLVLACDLCSPYPTAMCIMATLIVKISLITYYGYCAQVTEIPLFPNLLTDMLSLLDNITSNSYWTNSKLTATNIVTEGRSNCPNPPQLPEASAAILNGNPFSCQQTNKGVILS